MGAFLFVLFYIFILWPLAGAIDNAIAIHRLERQRRERAAPSDVARSGSNPPSIRA